MDAMNWFLTVLAIVLIGGMVWREQQRGRRNLSKWVDAAIFAGFAVAFLVIVQATLQVYGLR